VTEVLKQNTVKRVLAAVFTVGALATAFPATSFADTSGPTPPPTYGEPGGGGH
jgi:hypothetical protein